MDFITPALELIIGALGVAIGVSIQNVIDLFRSRRGELTGVWEQVIPAQKGEPPKRDAIKCRQRGTSLYGVIHRKEPTGQADKKWAFQGKRVGSFVFLTFWTINPITNPDSCGTIQLHRLDSNNLKGFYVKSIMKAGRKAITGNLTEFELVWRRTNGTRTTLVVQP